MSRIVLAATGVLVASALLLGGGTKPGPLFWIGLGALAIATLGLAAVLAGLVERPVLTREGLVCGGLLAGLVAWSALTIWWSAQPDRSWDYANRGVVYLAFAVCGVLVGALVPRAPSKAAAGLAALLGALVLWALAGKVFPWIEHDYGRVARLRTPVGYWNALALLLAIALPLALWVAGRKAAPAWARALGAVLAFGVLVAVTLTYSRGGIALVVLAAVAWLALVPDERLESLAALAVAAVPAGVVIALAFALPGVTDDEQPLSVRRHDGAIFGVALLAGAAVVWAVAALAARREVTAEQRRSLTRAGLAGLGGLLAVGAIAFTAATGPTEWWHQFSNDVSEQNTSGVGHLTNASSGNRWIWWQEAWHGFTDHPVQGSGAGTFDLTHRLHRENSLDVTEPHQLPLQFLTETGLIGFLLALGAALAALLGLWRVLGRRDGERPARVALALAVPVYLAYSLVDFDWDFVAVTGPVLLVAGLLLTAGGRPAGGRRVVFALAVLTAGAACAYSLAAPWLSIRKVDEVYAALDAGDPARAAALAHDAHRLNPLSGEPLLALADAELSAQRYGHALGALRKAADDQPENWQPRYDLGVFELEVLNDPCRAYFDLNRAYTLDRFGLPGRPGGPLDEAREAVNNGACQPRS